MEHEILFRAKAINRDAGSFRTNYKNGDWVYGLVTRLYDERYENLPAEMTNTSGVSCIEVDYKTVGRFTGLTDKNGVKIFEGDIVRSTETSVIGIVQWFSEHSAFMIWCKSFNKIEFLYECAYVVEVIGNIHDNPELLKGEPNV